MHPDAESKVNEHLLEKVLFSSDEKVLLVGITADKVTLCAYAEFHTMAIYLNIFLRKRKHNVYSVSLLKGFATIHFYMDRFPHSFLFLRVKTSGETILFLFPH